jgi:diguanylate cyclase (GGDEF)-like protein
MPRDELASRRKAGEASAPPSPPADPPVDEAPATDGSDKVDQHSSAPEALDAEAHQRDARAEARDEAGAKRDSRLGVATDEMDGLGVSLAARDRAAASLDRAEAALDRHRAREYLRRTYRDDLTGALQRMSGRDVLSHEVDRSARTGEPLLIAFLDVVNLKTVNDTHGHAAGDQLLRAVGQALCNGLRSYDTVVRYGGDEFVCGLPNARLDDAAGRFADVGQLLVDRFANGSVRIGVAELKAGEPLDAAIGRADRDLYARQTVLGSAPSGNASGAETDSDDGGTQT